MSDSVPPPPPPSSGGTPPPPPPPPAGGTAHPPPPPGAMQPAPTPAPSYQQAPYQPAPYGQAPPFSPVGGPDAGQPPRPQVKVGSILIIVGALIAILGTFLPWANLGNETGTGFDFYRFRDNFDVIEFDSPGVIVLFFAAPLIGFGLALLLAGRVLAVAIIAIIVSVIAAIVGLVMIGLMGAVTDDIGGSIGYGAVLTMIGPLVALAGAITATAKRRRWS